MGEQLDVCLAAGQDQPTTALLPANAVSQEKTQGQLLT